MNDTMKIVVPTAAGKPQVIVDAAHYGKLHELASMAMERDPEVATLLLDELERAELRSIAEMPVHVVTIGSEVTFRYNNDGHAQTIQLVLPKDADISKGRISVLTPIGATLLGLAEGDAMEWITRLRDVRSLTILKVKQLTEQRGDAASFADASGG